jgi:tetratricopeptide (TPR) repeat protein
MSVSLQPPSVKPVKGAVAPPAEAAARPGFMRRVLLIAGAVLLIFAATYALAWFNANRLSARFISEADALYDEGRYLDALVGYEEFDPQTNRYATRGGYVRVERIWSNSNSWPIPAQVELARQRSDEIINQRLTIEDAENYIQANIGRPALYFAEIYLRLGELYEADGDPRSAADVYRDVVELFSNRPDLTARAEEHLARLGE